MSRTRLERETVIIWNDAEGEATITTASPSVIRKLTKLGYTCLVGWPGHSPENKRFTIPKTRISFRRPMPRSRRGFDGSRTPATEGVSEQKRAS